MLRGDCVARLPLLMRGQAASHRVVKKNTPRAFLKGGRRPTRGSKNNEAARCGRPEGVGGVCRGAFSQQLVMECSFCL